MRSITSISSIVIFTILSLLAVQQAVAQPIPSPHKTVALYESQLIEGAGHITRILAVDVNDYGEVVVQVETDMDKDHDLAVLKDGQLLLHESQFLPGLAKDQLSDLHSLAMNNEGHTATVLTMKRPKAAGYYQGVFLNDVLLIVEDGSAPSTEFGPLAKYGSIQQCYINDKNQVLAVASVEDPAHSLTPISTLVRLDTFAGVLAGQAVLATAGESVSGHPLQSILTFGAGANDVRFNDLGQVMYRAEVNGAEGHADAIFIGPNVIAYEGAPSPVPGRIWGDLGLAKIDLNDQGDYAISGRLAGSVTSDEVLVRSGEVFRREGDSLPAFAPYNLTTFGSGPVDVTNSGDVLWFGDWNAPDFTRDSGLFVNDELILHEGVTIVDGAIIKSLATVERGYAISDNGRYIAALAVFPSATFDVDAVILIDRGPWSVINVGHPGTYGTPLLRGHGSLLPGHDMALRISNGMPESVAHMVLGLSRVDLPMQGMTLVPSPDLMFYSLPLDPNGEFLFGHKWPVGLPAGFEFVFQTFHPDSGAVGGLAASNGLIATAP